MVIFFFLIILTSNLYSAEKIGLITSTNGNIYLKDLNGNKVSLYLYDEVFLKDEIFTDSDSSVTIQYIDNSTFILKQNSSIQINEFDISGSKNIFLGEIRSGTVIIESGKISKQSNGSMKIKLPNMMLDIKGTRLNINTKLNGSAEVTLAEDSFGKVGQINVSTENKSKTLFDIDEVVFINEENNIVERPITEAELNEASSISEILIQASKVDDALVQKSLESRLVKGSLQDANNDGKIDISDVTILKERIKLEKLILLLKIVLKIMLFSYQVF